MVDGDETSYIWIWLGEGPSSHPSAVFANRRDAHKWITSLRLQGVLTAYPIGISVYDWAIKEGFFKLEDDEQRSPEFIQNFDTEYLNHYHYVLDEDDPDDYFLFPNSQQD